MLPIETGIALPSSKGRAIIYPFPFLNVGESFLKKCTSRDEQSKYQNSIHAVAWRHKRRYGKVFTTRKVDNGVRCWRVA